jgi:chromosome segregation ATPase
MFNQTSYKNFYPNQMNNFQNQYIPQMEQLNLINSHSQYIPISNNENYSCYSSTSTNTGVSQMSSIYMINQKKKALTDEFNNCLSQSLENILPKIVSESAKKIYESIYPSIEKNENQIKELKNQIEMIKNNLKNLTYLTKGCTTMRNLSSISHQINSVNSSINNCNIILNNQISLEKDNADVIIKQNEKIKEINEKFNIVKNYIEGNNKNCENLNNKVKEAFENIINTKEVYKEQICELNNQIDYGKNFNNSNNETKDNLEKLENSINLFANDIEKAEQIMIKPKNGKKFRLNRFCLSNEKFTF